MLSFMREQGLEEPSGQKLPTDGDEDSKRNEAPPQVQAKSKQQRQEYLTVASRDKNARKSTVLLAGLFCLGLLGLWFMIKKSSPQTATASPEQVSKEEAQIETAIARLIGFKSEIFNRVGEIVKKFYEFSGVQQVKVNELKKNPFKREVFLGNLNERSATEEENLDTNAKIMRQQQLRQQAKNMQLLSIVATDTGNFCVIDDRRLYEGDSIKGFNVRQIGDRTVLLESDGVEIILKLSE
jgi:preprotein translocase subunit SecG